MNIKVIKKFSLMLAILLISSLVLVACNRDDDNGGDKPPVPTGITITATDNRTLLLPTDTVQLTASVVPTGAVQTVAWSSATVATATINDVGLVTAVAAGSTVITATSTENNVANTITITVARDAEHILVINFINKWRPVFSAIDVDNLHTLSDSALITLYTELAVSMEEYDTDWRVLFAIVGEQGTPNGDELHLFSTTYAHVFYEVIYEIESRVDVEVLNALWFALDEVWELLDLLDAEVTLIENEVWDGNIVEQDDIDALDSQIVDLISDIEYFVAMIVSWDIEEDFDVITTFYINQLLSDMEMEIADVLEDLDEARHEAQQLSWRLFTL